MAVDPDQAPADVRALAREFARQGDPYGWFEKLYAAASGDARTIPWGDLVPNPNLTDWLARERIDGTGRRAAVVGCGLGDDAEALAGLGFSVLGFDLAPTAIAWATKRYPGRGLDFQVADLLDLPSAWRGAFDFVFEAYTLQAVPLAVRGPLVRPLASLLKPGGTLLIVTRGRNADEPVAELPWPLAKSELTPLLTAGLHEVRWEDYLDREAPPKRRFRIEYRRPG